MASRLKQCLRDPLFLLCLTAGLLAFVVQSGELGTSDTAHRLQTTHWLWTSEPQVFPNEYPEFGLHGRGGRLYSWYGIGQSLLMLPADLLGTWIAHWPIFSDYGDDPSVRSIVVSYATNILVNILTALIALRFLRQLRFGMKESVAGVLALLFATTHLHYTQNMMENNYIMLLTLTGFSFQYEWLRTDNRRALFWGSCALGLNLLTRLTTGLDLMAAGVFVLLVLWFERSRFGSSVAACPGLHQSRRSGLCILSPGRSCLPVLPLRILHQHLRFDIRLGISPAGSNAPRELSLEHALSHWFPRRAIPAGEIYFSLRSSSRAGYFPPGMAVEAPDSRVRAYGATSLLLLLAYISFYARYTYWAGDFAWGDRYVSTTVELVTLVAVPLLMRYRETLGRTIWRAGCGLIAVSVMIQIASLAFWLPLEIYQMETLGHPTFVIALRFKNIAAFALGKMDAWGLNTEAMTQDPWDYVHITTWNFLPFLLRRVGATPNWAVNSALAIWLAGIAALGSALVRLRSSLRTVA